VVGLLPGSARPDEIITVTSHYDHLGVGAPVDGDSIYNGAYDNASGTALLIEMAETFAGHEPRPGRSLLFIATAAEEAGLLGATWYVQSPLFPLSRTVAEVNVDGANLWGETEDMTAMGADRSDLGPFVETRAAELGLVLVPDAEPEKGFFFRSDHFPFAKAGVPALYIEHGRTYRGRPAGWGDSIQTAYSERAYHAPADEWSDDFTFEGALQQGTLAYLTILDLANDTSWPNWSEESEFRAARDRMMEEAGR
jgi:Zn-dependent M28 family amino/carboxypeptidase